MVRILLAALLIISPIAIAIEGRSRSAEAQTTATTTDSFLETIRHSVVQRTGAPDAAIKIGVVGSIIVVKRICAFALVAVMFLIALRNGMPEAEVRALVFFSLVMAIVALILVNRSFGTSLITALRRPNRTLGIVLVAVVAMLSLTLLVPIVRDLFRFGPLHLDDLALSVGAGIGLLIVLEGLKWLGQGLLAFLPSMKVSSHGP
jgi:Ca2+-transporting ATPase